MNSNQHFFKSLTLSIATTVLRWGLCAALHRFTSILILDYFFFHFKAHTWLSQYESKSLGWAGWSLHSRITEEYSFWQDFLNPWSCGSSSNSTVQIILFSRTKTCFIWRFWEDGFWVCVRGWQHPADWRVQCSDQAASPCRALSGHQEAR